MLARLTGPCRFVRCIYVGIPSCLPLIRSVAYAPAMRVVGSDCSRYSNLTFFVEPRSREK